MIFRSYASLPEGNFKKIAAEMLTIEIYVEFLRLKFHGHFPMIHILINDVPGDFDDMATNAEWNSLVPLHLAGKSANCGGCAENMNRGGIALHDWINCQDLLYIIHHS